MWLVLVHPDIALEGKEKIEAEGCWVEYSYCR